jgi:hypothetical protein
MLQPTSHFLSADGATLHYLRWGEPRPGRPVAVLTHGLSFVAASSAR